MRRDRGGGAHNVSNLSPSDLWKGVEGPRRDAEKAFWLQVVAVAVEREQIVELEWRAGFGDHAAVTAPRRQVIVA